MTEALADVCRRIERIFVEILHVVVSARTDLFGSGVLDSLSFILLLSALEVEFGIQIPVDGIEIERFRTVERIAEVVEELRFPAHSDSQAAA
jgi:acyl carrier protein